MSRAVRPENRRGARRLLAHVRREGTKRGARDLIIAATAAATRRVVLIDDRSARFGDLPAAIGDALPEASPLFESRVAAAATIGH